jgi:5-methylcytosine-specific restriction endonuclease McrA
MDTGTRNRRLDDLYAGRPQVSCLWCLRGVKRHKATIEHVQPRSLGGGDEPDNLDVACRKCNTSRNHSAWVPARGPLDPFPRLNLLPATRLRWALRLKFI